MLSFVAVGPLINDHPDGVTCACAFDVSKNAKPNSPDATGVDPYVCEYPVTADALLCHATTPSRPTGVANPEISVTENSEKFDDPAA